MQSALVSSYLQNDDETRFVEVVFPKQSNHYGTLFAGTALSLMGKAAFVAASRRARRTVVMGSSDKVDFLQPVLVGQIAELRAHVVRVGTASMTVEVEIIAETLVSGQRVLAARGRFEMIAVDATGRPTAIETLTPSVEDPAA
ncbi:MAG: acyl-CoA thioesterase [Reyranellaceae bacterium]